MPYQGIVHQGHFSEADMIANSFHPTTYQRESGYIMIKQMCECETRSLL